MELDLVTVVAVAAVLGASALLQAAIGFAFALFAVPLLTLAGLSPAAAIAASSVGMGVQMVFGSLRLRDDLRAEPMSATQIIGYTLIALAGVAGGTLTLRLVSDVSPALAAQVIGVVLLAAVVFLWLAHPRPRAKVAPSWTLLAMLGSGYSSGVAGMGGPPLVLWAMAHTWSSARIRATIWVLLLPRLLLQLTALYVAFGTPVLTGSALGALATPLVLGAAALGLLVGRRISAARLRPIALAVLTVMALSAIVRPLLGL